ncbi:MAG: 5-methyltetrahydropteroyltriglutamate--homocysteine S-methyltransferase [Bacteroidota bacterium]
MITSSTLGFPRIGAQRELKKAVEAYWAGDRSQADLHDTARSLRLRHWQQQQEAGINHIPSNDFSFYDQVLDTIAMVGAVPPRFDWDGDHVDLDTYFAMARGVQEKEVDASDSGSAGAPAMEMTKWYDTNYHYIVPEFDAEQTFSLSSTKAIDAYTEARDAGIETRPVLLGPVSFLLLGKMQAPHAEVLELLDALLPVYADVLQGVADAGASAVQMDEPHLVMDLSEAERRAFRRAYDALSNAADVDLALTTYFGRLGANMQTVFDLPVDSVHLDLVRAPGQLPEALDQIPESMQLSLGLVDGRNVWRADLDALHDTVQQAVDALGTDRVQVGPSCSLLHVPVDLDTESNLDDEVRPWLAFAVQKLDEIAALADQGNGAPADAQAAFAASREAREQRSNSERIHNPEVQDRVASITSNMKRRDHPHEKRRVLQQEHLDLPLLPTTTIGSFPQTSEVRKKRAAHKRGDLLSADYEAFLEDTIAETLAVQEEIGLDLLVHGEPERSDMVEYFGQQMTGILFTEHGWVQSYGTRCVRPPVIYGDVARPEPMTVRWLAYAQSCTDQPVKGMLTGPVTILQWSFVRDDQPRASTCRQIALAIRDEVADLEAAGIQAVQIDEPAFREGLPLREADAGAYLDWAVECFRLASAGADDATQIHTHMCYSAFNDIIDSIAAMDADVISMEASRSKMELLEAFDRFDYPNEIGPGVYDIHSPRVPSVEEIETLIEKALDVLEAEQLWVNPDCGLKTRRWVEVKPALANMVQAARNMRVAVAA